ncbi:hypothetical protein PoB_004770200 [Plakobranchus ocellatus]|uniref:Uncharacterized protein n=1 Tax=Plakobranchus ocellatus TaxID=259542 RepID=A0AAV4BQE5_9GAST|nr:hypothetical protein PoB_004770200 [Plakobranchus ocellatus]
MPDTQLDAVAPPYLHILLGIVAKHHSHMERDAAILDQKILEERAKLSNLSKKYEKYCMRWEEALPFVKEKKFLKTCIVFSDEMNKKRMTEQDIEEADLATKKYTNEQLLDKESDQEFSKIIQIRRNASSVPKSLRQQSLCQSATLKMPAHLYLYYNMRAITTVLASHSIHTKEKPQVTPSRSQHWIILKISSHKVNKLTIHI